MSMENFKKYLQELTSLIFDFDDEVDKKLSLCQYFFPIVTYSDRLRKLQRAAYRDIIVSPAPGPILNSVKKLNTF